MDTIIIGGNKPHAINGKSIFKITNFIDVHINDIDKYYWVDFRLFGSFRDEDRHNMIIYENAPEYKEITELLSSEVTSRLTAYVNTLAVKYSDSEFIVQKVEGIIDWYHDLGRRSAQRKMRIALGLEDRRIE